MLVDWRTMLGLAPTDQVLCVGTGAERIRRMLLPFTGRRIAPDAGPHATLGHMDWVICGDPLHVDEHATREDARAAHVESLRQVLAYLRPGGHVAVRVFNRWGLHGVLGTRDRDLQQLHGAHDRVYSLRGWRALLEAAGAEDVRCYALLPHPEAPRVVLPVHPSCPVAAQRLVIEKVWKRPTRAGTLGRRLLGVLARVGVLAHLFPYYLLVGRRSG